VSAGVAAEGKAQLSGEPQRPVVVESADQNHRAVAQIPKAREHGIAHREHLDSESPLFKLACMPGQRVLHHVPQHTRIAAAMLEQRIRQ